MEYVMEWQSSMTRQGLKVLAGLQDQSVSIVSVWAGSGTVEESLLCEQTQLVDPKQEMAIIEDYSYENMRDMRLQLWSKNVSSGFILNQIGFFVSVNGGEPLLYIIAQNPDGEGIPSSQTTANFILEYLTTLIFTFGSEVKIEVKEVGFITPDALNTRLKHFREQLEVEFANDVELTDAGLMGHKLYFKLLKAGMTWSAAFEEPVSGYMLTDSGDAAAGGLRLEDGTTKNLSLLMEKRGF